MGDQYPLSRPLTAFVFCSLFVRPGPRPPAPGRTARQRQWSHGAMDQWMDGRSWNEMCNIHTYIGIIRFLSEIYIRRSPDQAFCPLSLSPTKPAPASPLLRPVTPRDSPFPGIPQSRNPLMGAEEEVKIVEEKKSREEKRKEGVRVREKGIGGRRQWIQGQ